MLLMLPMQRLLPLLPLPQDPALRRIHLARETSASAPLCSCHCFCCCCCCRCGGLRLRQQFPI